MVNRSDSALVLIDIWGLSERQKIPAIVEAFDITRTNIKRLMATGLPIVANNSGRAYPPGFDIKSTARISDYDTLIYAGYATDACLAFRPEGYRKQPDKKRYIVYDATLIKIALYHPDKGWWKGHWYGERKARPASEQFPWTTAQDLLDETEYFCRQYASKYAEIVSTEELCELLS